MAPSFRAGLCLACLLPILPAPAAEASPQSESGRTARATAVPIHSTGHDGFARVPSEVSGLHFTNQLSPDRYLTNQIYLNGSGVALGDVDADGRCDLYFCGLDSRNALFRNLGDWRFAEVTESAGLACPDLWCTGAVMADVDGDADLDLLVNTVGQGTHLYLNDGLGHFSASTQAPLNQHRAGMSAAFADLEGDGDLDLYITNYRTDTVRDRPETRIQGEQVNGRMLVRRVDGRPTTELDLVGRFSVSDTGQIVEHGEPDLLLLNDGKGAFNPVSFTQGAFVDEAGQTLVEPPYDWGLSVAFRDLNGDGRPDLYVCNDFESPDRFWLNQGHGRFQAAPRLSLRHTSIFSMGIDVGDLNRDGHDDLLISDMLMQAHASRQLRIGEVPPVRHGVAATAERPQYSFNTLQLARGDGTYAEVAFYAHAEASGWTWCPVLLDLDLDGFEDVLFPTGHQMDMMNGDVIEKGEVLKAQRKLSRREQQQLRRMFARFDTPNVAFRNLGDGRFEDHSAAWGFTDAAVSQGIALGDLDGDGDLDAVVNNLNGPAVLYRNLASAPRVAVRLRGLAPNTSGVGARLVLRDGATPLQSQTMVTGAHYLSSDELLRVFAARRDGGDMRLEVRWPSGRRSLINDVKANHLYEVDEAQATPGPSTPPLAPDPWFESVAGFAPRHQEDLHDDAIRQPLLPFRLSQGGPGVGWLDYDGDGWEDLVVGNARGGLPAFFHNTGRGGLEPADAVLRSRPLARDQAGVVGAEGTFLIGASNYEDGTTNGGWVRIYDLRRPAAGDSLLGPTASTGPLALADVDDDGDLDLFVGGRVQAGRYPEPATSILFQMQNGRLTPVRVWEKLGLVSGAVFSDLNHDGRPDLVLACDWGPIRVFYNQGAWAFQEVTRDLGFEAWTGWWQGVTCGDFDGDGRLDIAASNWGRNSRYQATPERPLRCYYGDLDGDSVVDLVEAQFDPASNQEVPLRGFRAVGSAFPWLKDQVGTFEAYGKAGTAQLYGERLRACQVLQVTTLASMVFLNRTNHFDARELPPEAQWTPAFGITVGDFDGDACEDLFLAQNFFAVPPDGTRLDAGRGLWLRGDGQGHFQPVAGQEAGILIYGEQRGCATADYDGDGRIDLVVAQNGETAVLLHNRRGKPGLRVRLQEKPGNREGFGASLRLKSGTRHGPLREVHSGAGYWSQDGPVQVLYAPEPPTELEVRWPGGLLTTTPITTGTREITVSRTGIVKALP